MRRKGFNHEWHLYSTAVFILVTTFFFFTAFNPFWATVGSALVVAMSGLMVASDNWKNLVAPEAHKAIMLVFFVGGLLWAFYLLCVDKMLPYLSRKRIKVWPKQN